MGSEKMAVILGILKFIGLVLLCLIGLILLIVAAVLFVPVRYRMLGQNKFGLVYCVTLSWLWGAAAVKKEMSSEEIWLKLFGIPIFCLYNPEKKESKPKKTEKPEKIEKPKPEKSKTESKPEQTGDDDEAKTDSKPKRMGKIKKRMKMKKGKAEKSKNFFSFHKISGIIDFIRDKENINAFRKIVGELRSLLRYLGPQVLRGEFILGTGDPSSTGLLFGVLSLFPVTYEDDVHICPDFEKKIFQMEGEIRGRIRVIYLVRLGIRLYRDEELISLWKKINREKKEAA
jgi:hypothetical protein